MNNQQNNNKIKFIYFGTGFFSEEVLKNLLNQNIKPEYIITSPDKPTGRHQIITAGPIKKIAIDNNINFLQPDNLKSEEFLEKFKTIIDENTLCVVCDYGKILPQTLLNLNTIDFINIHPSLLPKFRGPAPLQNTILQNNQETGVTIIKMDNKMDHGPIIAIDKIKIDDNIWPCSILELSKILAEKSSKILIDVFKKYQNKKIEYIEQDHQNATYTKMIEKKDAEIFPNQESISEIYLKYQAYKHWPEIFYINKDGKRVKIKNMTKNKINRIIIEGKKETDFMNF